MNLALLAMPFSLEMVSGRFASPCLTAALTAPHTDPHRRPWRHWIRPDDLVQSRPRQLQTWFLRWWRLEACEGVDYGLSSCPETRFHVIAAAPCDWTWVLVIPVRSWLPSNLDRRGGA
jgi:hypothetical protein